MSNWVNDVLDNAVRIVSAYPAWMRRPEFDGRGFFGKPVDNNEELHSQDISMQQQLELPFTDQIPYTPYYRMWHELFKRDKKLSFMTPKLATHYLIKADFHEDAVAEFLKKNTYDCKNCDGEGYYDMNMCHGMGARYNPSTPCMPCHTTGTVFINVPTHA